MKPSERTSAQVRAGWCGWLLGIGLVLATGPASAAIEYCVGSVDELSTALTVATTPTGQTIVIKLKQGTYHVGGSFLMNWHEYNAMRWLGGYNADCSDRSVRPSNTIIDGDGAILEPEVFIDGDWRKDSPNPPRKSTIDPETGRRRRQMSAALIHTVPLDNRGSLYLRWGDWFAAACSLAVAVTLTAGIAQRRRAGKDAQG